jgi:hypothetical protein
MASLFATGAMLIASNKELLRNGIKPTDFVQGKLERSAKPDLDVGSRLDAEYELKQAGKGTKETSKLSDEVLLDKVFNQRSRIEIESGLLAKKVPEADVKALTAGLGDDGVIALAQQAGGRLPELVTEVGAATILGTTAKVGSAATAGKLLVGLLDAFPAAELKSILGMSKHPEQIRLMLDHVGVDSGCKMLRQWASKGQADKMNTFLERLNSGKATELAETAGLGSQSIIVDSNTAIALMKDADPALKTTMNAGEIARVAYIKSLPPGTELRVGNVTVGEVQSGILTMRGVPLDVARESTAYRALLTKLEAMNLGGAKGAADRALIADAFFAKAEDGVTPTFMTGDKSIYNKLATEAGIDLTKIGGKTLPQLKPSGFDVAVDSRTLRVIPVAQ